MISGTGERPGGVQVRPLWLTTPASSDAVATPMTAPATPRIRPSQRKSRRMPPRRRPIARSVPISTVRSITAVLIVLPTVNSTIAPISSATKPTSVANIASAWP